LIAGVHAGAAQKLPGVTIEAVVNHRPESRAAFAAKFGIPREYADVEGLLKAGGVDGLVVCTPNYLHAPQSIAALEAGVPVLVEKPMAISAAEGEAMLAASRTSGACLMVGHVWRFDPEVQWLRDQVRTGRLGRIVRTKGYCSHVNRGPMGAGWFTQKELAGGGAMADMGIHVIDTARFLLDDPQPISVYAKIGTYYGDFSVDDTAVVMVNWADGATSYIEAGWWQPQSDGMQAATQLYGTTGFGRIFPTYMEIRTTPKPDIERVETDIKPVTERDKREKFVPQMAHFVDCIRTGRQPVPGGAEGLVNMKVVDAAYRSSETDQVVTLYREEARFS
jgi:predicted dehydrogenase